MQSSRDAFVNQPYAKAILIVLLLLLGAALRLAPLPHEALGGDELFSRRVVLQTVPAAFAEVRSDLVHPPFYYALLKSTTAIWGAGALGLRALSLACGIASVGVIILLGSRLPGGRWCGYLAGGGLAVGRNYIYYSQEARSYALYSLLVLLLVFWMEALPHRQRSGSYWVLGASLMTILVYTHYVGAIYVMGAILTILLCKFEIRTKVLAVVSGLVAAGLFLPWLLTVLTVYKQKRGLGENLDWQGRPALADLKQLWASSVGIATFPGATTLALLLIIVLSAVGLFSLQQKGTLRRSPAVLALAVMGVLPPIVIFVLSQPPFNLPLFGLRHLLPSMVLLLLLSSYGVECIAHLQRVSAPYFAAGCAACILVLGALPTIQGLRSGPMRYPYNAVEQRVVQSASLGVPSYTTWFYGEGEPINFYCRMQCIQPLPSDVSHLPRHLLLIYRPRVKDETAKYSALKLEGYVDASHRYYTDGVGTAWGTMAADLER